MFYKVVLVVLIGSVCSYQTIAQQIRPLPNAIININCGQLTILRTTGLISPGINALIPDTCTYRILPINALICQVRLDFRSFTLAQPTFDVAGFPQCTNDAFTVGNITLCGENTGQHIYVPINPRAGEREIQVTVRLASRNSGLIRPSWNIVVNQLECPIGLGRSLNIDETETKEAASFSSNQTLSDEDAKHIQRVPRTFVSDWMAPSNCLQYYPEETGTIESFNFGNGIGPYIGNMNYAICFRRLRHHSQIRFFATVFQMSFLGAAQQNNGIDDNCLSTIPTRGLSEDYVMIPNAMLDNPDARGTRFCHNSLLSRNVFSSPPTSFLMLVNTDSVFNPQRPEIGFRINYQIS